MARKTAIRTKKSSANMRMARLDLIKKRYEELILHTRALIAADLDDELDDQSRTEDLELSHAVKLNPA